MSKKFTIYYLKATKKNQKNYKIRNRLDLNFQEKKKKKTQKTKLIFRYLKLK